MPDRVSMAKLPPPAPPAPQRPPVRDTGRDAIWDAAGRPGPAGKPQQRRQAVWGAALAAGLWVALTGPAHWHDPATWLFGAAAVAAVAALVWVTPARAAGHDPSQPVPRLSPGGVLRLSGWFCVQAVRGAVDVSRRAFAPSLPVAPGWHRHPLGLPPGAPRLVMANAITMLPGTLTAELHEDDGAAWLVVHLLDARVDPVPGLAALEARVRAAFGLPDPSHPRPTPRPEVQP